MEQFTHRQSVRWIRAERRMTSLERQTVVHMKDFNDKLLCKVATFCRVEAGL